MGLSPFRETYFTALLVLVDKPVYMCTKTIHSMAVLMSWVLGSKDGNYWIIWGLKLYKLDELWEKCLAILKLEMTSVSYKTYIESIKPIALEHNKITLCVDSETQFTLIRMKHQSAIESALIKVTGEEIQVNLTMPGMDTGSTPEITGTKSHVTNGLNKNYTFDNFVVGDNNRMAFTGALNVAELPSLVHNPLFIYSAPGLGKTHLMHAIGNFILESNPEAKVMYVTSESFTNEFITYLQQRKNMQEFRNKYRYCSLLLIDDIQFLARKKETQEEFFHTFNALMDNNAQIVISSDRPPREIRDLEERLYSRFSMGLMADISHPELETRIAILRRKVEEEHMDVPFEVINYIADTITTNIRELEGSLQRVKAYAKLKNANIDINLTKEAFKGIYDAYKPSVVTPKKIKETVCDYMNVTIEDLEGVKRSRNIVFPRQIAQYLIRVQTNLSYPMIAEQFSVKDHTTIIHSCDKIEKEIKQDERTRTIVKDLTGMLSK